MMTVDVEVAQLRIETSGLPADVVKDALTGLEHELHRVLGHASFAITSDFSLSSLELEPIEVMNHTDARELRRLLAERLGAVLLNAVKGGT